MNGTRRLETTDWVRLGNEESEFPLNELEVDAVEKTIQELPKNKKTTKGMYALASRSICTERLTNMDSFLTKGMI